MLLTGSDQVICYARKAMVGRSSTLPNIVLGFEGRKHFFCDAEENIFDQLLVVVSILKFFSPFPTCLNRMNISLSSWEGNKPGGGGGLDRDSSKPLHDGEIHSRHDRFTSYHSAVKFKNIIKSFKLPCCRKTTTYTDFRMVSAKLMLMRKLLMLTLICQKQLRLFG
jgi:hypothetical protein